MAEGMDTLLVPGMSVGRPRRPSMPKATQLVSFLLTENMSWPPVGKGSTVCYHTCSDSLLWGENNCDAARVNYLRRGREIVEVINIKWKLAWYYFCEP